MQDHRFIKTVGFIISVCCALTTSAWSVEFTVSLNTAPLIGHAAGPFSLDFQLNDGSGIGDANNTAIVTNFNFGVGGAPASSPSSAGGASGNLSTAVSLTDSGFLNYLLQQFTPGNTLSFTIQLTTNVESPTPDQFSFGILDSGGNEIPTLGPGDAFLTVDLSSGTPTNSYASDPSRTPVAGGSAINIAKPVVIPEPAIVALVSLALAGFLVLNCRRR